MKNIFKKNQLMITARAIMIAIAGYLQFAENTMNEKTGELAAVDSGKVITETYVASDVKSDLEDAGGLTMLLDLSEEDLLALQGTADGVLEGADLGSLDEDGAEYVQNYLEEGMDLVVERPGNPGEEGQGAPASATPGAGEIPGEAVFTSAGAWILSDAKLLKEQTRAKNKATLLDVIGREYLSDDQKQQAVSTIVEMTQIAEKEAAAEILLEAKGFADVVVSITGSGVDVVVNATSLTDAQRAQIEDIVQRKTQVSPENIIISTVVKD